MRVCKYPTCHHTESSKGCSMHKFPIAREKCILWLDACGFETTPSKLPAAYYLCSCHFSNGPNTCPDRVCDDDDDLDVESTTPTKDMEASRDQTSIPSQSIILNDAASDILLSGISPKTDPSGGSQHLVGLPDWTPTLSSVIELDTSDDESFTDVRNPSPSRSNTSEISIVSGEDSGIRSQSAIFGSAAHSACDLGDEDDFNDFQLLSPAQPLPSRACINNALELLPEGSPVVQDDSSPRPPIKRRRRTLFAAEETSNCEGKQFRDVGIQCSRPPLSYELCIKSWKPEVFKFYTSLTPDGFEVLYQLLGGDKELRHVKYQYQDNTPRKERESEEHSIRDKLFITLMRLRRGFTLLDLKVLFHLSEASLSTIFYAWIRIMSLKFKTLAPKIFVSARIQSLNPPDCYKPFENLRCIFDCFEIKVQRSENMEKENNTHSDYKGACTHKFLLATSVYGGLCYISESAEGNISDKRLVVRSGVLDHLKAGEAIMADKGFDIESELNRRGIHLYMPEFLGQRDNFTAREMLLNKAISPARVHVERFIKMMRDFRLIRWQFPNSMADILSDCVCVAANLVMFEDPFIRWEHLEESTT